MSAKFVHNPKKMYGGLRKNIIYEISKCSSDKEVIQLHCPIWYLSFLTDEIYSMTKYTTWQVVLYNSFVKNEIYKIGQHSESLCS